MKKKIVSIVCASVVAVLVATVVVLGFVKTNKNTFVTRPDAVYVMNIRTKSNAGGYGAAVFEDLVGRKSEEVSKMFNNFNSAFEHSVLEGIVSNQNDMAMTPQFVHTAAGAEHMSRNFDSSTKITIVFYYKTPKTICVDNKTFDYNYLFFELSDSTQKSTIQFGVDKAYDATEVEPSGLDLELKGDESDNYLAYDYGYTCKVNLHDLYVYAASLI